MNHSHYHDDTDVQSAIVACIEDMIGPGREEGTMVRGFVIKSVPIRVTTNEGVLCMVEQWEPVGGGMARRVLADMRCFVCQAAIEEDPHTFHAEGCPKRNENPCEPYMCIGLSGCGEDCHAECCPTCNDVDPDAPVLGYGVDGDVTAGIVP